jgi:hypothetical protein
MTCLPFPWAVSKRNIAANFPLLAARIALCAGINITPSPSSLYSSKYFQLTSVFHSIGSYLSLLIPL